jgi:uncharacterized protein YecT (DUF1311 family)
MRSFFTVVAIVACAISCGLYFCIANEEPVATERPSGESSPDTTASKGSSLATAGTAEQPEVLYTSPSGAFRIELSPAKGPATEERASGNVWLVSTKDPGVHVKMPALEGVSSFDDDFHFAPNDEWIFGTRKMAHGFSNGDLFHRIDPQHIKIAPTEKDQSFNDLVWPYCVKQGALKANYSAEEDDADVGMTDFVAWSFDSSRLLVQLRGGDRHRTLHSCYVYFNTRKKTFEMTDYLRKLNKTKSEVLACAEPVDPLPSEDELKTRLDALDRQLNKRYAEVIAKTVKDQVSNLREAQRNWIKHRDEGAKLYMSIFPAAERERRRLQFFSDVTAARIDTPAEEWEVER